MTIILNSGYDVTLSTALLGYVGETNARPVSVEGLTVDGADRYVLTIDYGDGVTYEVDITGGQWTPTADILRSAQTVSCQIAAKKLSGQEYILVKKSRIFRLRIGAAIGDNAVPSPDVAMDALDRIDAIGRQTHADMQTAVTAAETATTAAENAKKSATNAEKSADTATQAASRAETAQASAETSATQADTARQGAETARTETVTAQNAAKISAAQASVSAQQTTADKTTVADNATKVAEDRTAAETAAQTAQAVADSLPEDYTTAVGKIAENTADIASIKLNDKEMKRRVDALYDIGQGITHKFETDSDTAYAKTVPTGGKLMSVKSIGGHSEVIDGEIVSAGVTEVVEQGRNLFDVEKCAALGLYYGFEIDTNKTLQIALKDEKTCPTNVSFGIVYVHGNTMANWLITSKGVRETITNSRDMTDSTQIMVACYPGNKETMQSIADAFDIMLVDGIYKSDTMPAYAPYHSNVYQIPETIKTLPGYGVEGNVADYEAKTYTQNNAIDGTAIKALDTPIITDISSLIPDDFLRNVEVEAGGSVTFKSGNDDYRIPVPNEEEYIVKLSEVGGTT